MSLRHAFRQQRFAKLVAVRSLVAEFVIGITQKRDD
jgi:hypothetical protein